MQGNWRSYSDEDNLAAAQQFIFRFGRISSSGNLLAGSCSKRDCRAPFWAKQIGWICGMPGTPCGITQNFWPEYKKHIYQRIATSNCTHPVHRQSYIQDRRPSNLTERVTTCAKKVAHSKMQARHLDLIKIQYTALEVTIHIIADSL